MLDEYLLPLLWITDDEADEEEADDEDLETAAVPDEDDADTARLWACCLALSLSLLQWGDACVALQWFPQTLHSFAGQSHT